MVVTTAVQVPYRASVRAFGWPIEVLVHTRESYHTVFARDIPRRRPSVPRMCAEGLILKEPNGLTQQFKDEAKTLLEHGPTPLPAASSM